MIVRQRWLRPALLCAVVGLIIAGTAATMVALWPGAVSASASDSASDSASNSVSASGPAADSAPAQMVTARIVSADVLPCTEIGAPGSAQAAPGVVDDEGDAGSASGSATGGADAALAADPASQSAPVAAAPRCTLVRATLPIGQTVSFTMDAVGTQVRDVRAGDTVRLIANELQGSDGVQTVYAFYDHPRGGKMLVVAIVFALLVIAVGRWRGALALVGVGVAVALLAVFVLPAILQGRPAVPVAVAGSLGIMVVVLYLAHGISQRTTAALFGSVFGIGFTALVGLAVTHWLRFTGVVSTEEASLLISVPGLHMGDVLTATIVIAGLGVLNDITVAQASAVWELRELNPQLSKRSIARSAMRIGRDHIASSIYTLVFAYAGAMFIVLLLVATDPGDLLSLITSEQIAQEVIRTLIGAAGLVLSMPVTTAFAVLLAPAPAVGPRPQRECDGVEAHEEIIAAASHDAGN